MLRKIIMKASKTNSKNMKIFRFNVDLLFLLPSNERSKVAEAFEEVTFADGEVIVKQGRRRRDLLHLLARVMPSPPKGKG